MSLSIFFRWNFYSFLYILLKNSKFRVNEKTIKYVYLLIKHTIFDVYL